MNPQTVRKLPVTILAVSLVLNVALAAAVQRHRDKITSLTQRPGLEVGDKVPALQGLDLWGKPLLADPTRQERTLLYVFSAACGWCERNAANMGTVFRAALSQGTAVYAVALSKAGADNFINKHELDVPILVPTDAAREAYKLGATPQTLVLSRQGTVLKNWRGAYVAKNSQRISDYFGVVLPGLVEYGQPVK